jgi:secreted Zn-dependent insulinase-like peptidase
VIDEATVDLLENTILNKLQNMNKPDFNSAKRKNFDTIADARYDLSKASKRYFTQIMDNTYKFTNYQIMEKYSNSITKEDMVNFFEENFIHRENLRFTVYVRKLIVNNFRCTRKKDLRISLH